MLIGRKRIHLSEVNSTNEYLSEFAEKKPVEEGTLVTTDFQGQGKGMGQNTWHSEPSQNILLSFFIKPVFLPPDHVFCISQFVSLAIVNYLEFRGVSSVCIKWPNDIYIKDKKIAGILIRNELSPNEINASIVGIGLNVNQNSFSAKLPNPTSMNLVLGEVFEVESELKVLLESLNYFYDLIRQGACDDLNQRYHEKLYLLDHEHEFTDEKGKKFIGRIVGISDEGRLKIDSQGTIRSFDFKQVEY